MSVCQNIPVHKVATASIAMGLTRVPVIRDISLQVQRTSMHALVSQWQDNFMTFLKCLVTMSISLIIISSFSGSMGVVWTLILLCLHLKGGHMGGESI